MITPAMPFFGRPLLRYSLSTLRQLGVTEVGINTHHLPERMEAAAREAYESRVLRFQAGAATSNEVLDSETAVRRAQVDLVDAHLGYRLARARLEYVLGQTPETR